MGGGFIRRPLLKERIMIVLKKGNHYEHTTMPDKAAKMMQDGFEIVKGKSLLSKEKNNLKQRKSLLRKNNKTGLVHGSSQP